MGLRVLPCVGGTVGFGLVVARGERSKRGDLGSEVLALLHLQWLRPYLSRAEIDGLLGPREFGSSVRQGRFSCEAIRVWGYKCPVIDPDSMSGDHLFPRSAGGVTCAENYLPLCKLHNGVKTNDIHLYPYYQSPQQWVFKSLDRRAKLVAKSLIS